MKFDFCIFSRQNNKSKQRRRSVWGRDQSKMATWGWSLLRPQRLREILHRVDRRFRRKQKRRRKSVRCVQNDGWVLRLHALSLAVAGETGV